MKQVIVKRAIGIFGIPLLLILGASLAFVSYRAEKEAALEGPAAPEAITLEEIEGPKVKEETPKVKELPTSLNIEMPFYTQAPYANWDYPWQEACEEASVLLVANLFNKMNLDRAAYNAELLRLVDWEMDVFGAYEHTTVAQTVRMIEENYGLKTLVHENPSFEDIRSILADGHLIVAPMAGKILKNPNFLNGGPQYHMVVIKGYDAEKMQIVTHDVGTKNGADYVYDWAVIEQALHDYAEPITDGTPRFIEVLPPETSS